MIRTKTFTTLILILLSTVFVYAQRGTVSGSVVDDATGEPIVSAIVTCPTAKGGGYTDFEGNFTASFDAGERAVSIKLVSYQEEIINVVIPVDGNIDAGVIRLKTIAEEAVKGGVTIRVKKSTTSESALITAQKKSVNLMDGTSKQAMAKVGDGDAAAAASRVTGVSIEGGKYVFVRGLGDRYTKTVLNGMELPGLDPDRNTIQMDIFPTNLIDNIVVLKSFTPNLAGDFTGGWVDVQTSDFQAKEVFAVSASLGYNPAMHFNGDYLTHGGGIGEAFAFGRSNRKIPFGEAKIIPRTEYTQGAAGAQSAQENANAFSKNLEANQQMSLLNTSFNINYGNQINKDKKTYGYNLAAGYSNTFNYYENAIYQTFIKDEDKSVNELLFSEKNNGTVAENEVLWSALANGSYKKGKNSLSTTLFHTQNGVKKTSEIIYENIANPFGDAGAKLDRSILYYNQRTLTSLMVEHTLKNDSGWSFTTKVSPSISSNNEPDMRITALSFDENNDYRFNIGAGSEVTRLYRSLTELNLNAKWDVDRTFALSNKRETKVRFGVANNIKNRDFGVFQYQYLPVGSFSLSGEPNQITNDYLFDADSKQGFTLFGEPQASNEFNSTLNVAAVYAMNEYPLTKRLMAIYGVRIEKADMFYTGENTSNLSYTNEQVLDELNVLPAVNFLFRATTDINVRLAGTRTLARPSFKEKSLAQILDPISGRTFIGNLDLEQTEVTNLDIRFEKFMKRGELISVSGFYKNFTNPIEIVVFKPETPTNFTPRNAVSANVFGAEFELKKGLDVIGLNDFSVATNVSYIISRVEMTAQEIEGKTNELRVGQELGTTREMQGQAPYIINFGLNYENKLEGFNANISYNVQGPKLAIVGIGRLPDVYTESFHSLNFKASYALMKDDKGQISFSVDNILADDNLQVYRGYEAQDQIFTQLIPQRTFKVGFSYKIK
jgi:TonB-dependent receptor